MALHKIRDPRLDIESQQPLVLEEGIETVNPQVIRASSASDSTFTFDNVYPPNSVRTVVDRKMYIKFPVTLTFTGTSVGPTLLQIGTNDALRAFPLAQLMNSVTLSINNVNTTSNPIDYIEPLLRYGTKNDIQEIDWSAAPSMLDQYQDYADWLTFGSAKNSLGGFGSSYSQQGRGGFSDLVVISDDGLTAVVEAIVTEPLFASPLLWSHAESKGLYGVSTISITAQLGALSRFWSHSSAGENITSIVGTLGTSTLAQPELLITYLTPKMPILSTSNMYNFNKISRFITAGSNVPAGGVVSLTSTTFTLSNVPKRLYMFARRSKATKTFNDTDTYFGIDSLRLTFGNGYGLLSNADKRQLYQISASNGYNASYDAANRYTGHVLCLDFSKDISLKDGVIPGMGGQFTLQAEVNLRNLSTAAITYEFIMVTVGEGVFEISPDTTNSRDATVGQLEIDNLALANVLPYYDVKDIDGGTFVNSVKDFGRKAAPWIGKTVQAAKTALPYAEKAASVIVPLLMGAGMSESEAVRAYKKGGGNVMGGYVVGGKSTNKNERLRKLESRLR